MTKLEIFLCLCLATLVFGILVAVAPQKLVFQPTSYLPTTMTAQQLIDLLARAPEMQMMIQVQGQPPQPVTNVSLNNEAKAWVIWVPKQQD